MPVATEVRTKYEAVIGLEVHVQLLTQSKLFCSCSTRFGDPPNTHVCPVCLGLPGALPVASRAAIEYTIRIGLALNCTIADWCRFARKNYFYPDMPKNFQISQYDEPLCTDGWLDVTVEPEGGGEPRQVRVGIERVHLEEDTGKSLHIGGATGRIHGADYSLVDYNRAGIPLVEIVTKPVDGTGALAPVVARAYVTELRDLLRALAVSDVRMEEGSLRCDVNTSLSATGSGRWGTRTETKNVNSLRSVERAVRFEIERQAAVLDEGGRVVQETRHFHEDTGATTAGRSKEEAQDYRYFPEPDLVPVAPSREWVEQIRASLPELPAARRARLKAEWGLSDHEFSMIQNAGAVDLVAATVTAGAGPAEADEGGHRNRPGHPHHRQQAQEHPPPPEQMRHLSGQRRPCQPRRHPRGGQHRHHPGPQRAAAARHGAEHGGPRRRAGLTPAPRHTGPPLPARYAARRAHTTSGVPPAAAGAPGEPRAWNG